MFSFGSKQIQAGESHTISNVPAGTALGVNPGPGGTVRVQYRISPKGQLFDWPSGPVTSQMSDVTGSPSFEIVFTALDADGFAEWNSPRRRI